MSKKFEDILVEIEECVKKLSDENIDIESSIKEYDLAMKLIGEAELKLNEVEGKIYNINKENNELEEIDTL